MDFKYSDKQKRLKLAYLLIITDFFSRLCYHDLMIVVIPKIITQNVCTYYSRLNILRIQIVYLASAIDRTCLLFQTSVFVNIPGHQTGEVTKRGKRVIC